MTGDMSRPVQTSGGSLCDLQVVVYFSFMLPGGAFVTYVKMEWAFFVVFKIIYNSADKHLLLFLTILGDLELAFIEGAMLLDSQCQCLLEH